MKETLNFKVLVAVFATGLLGGIAGYGISKSFSGNEPKKDEAKIENTRFTSLPTVYSSAEPTEFSTAAEKCIDGVVHVKTKYVRENQGYDNPFFQYFFGLPEMQQQPSQASGSGVIISKEGYIVTNNHVIENSTSIEVVLNDRRSYEARLIGTDPATDIALLKIEADSLTVIPIGNSDNLKIGEWVLAIGNPFNLTSTITAGIVSAKARNINILDHKTGAIESFIQTDAAVNPGNSGGALINTNGQLVGINTAIASQTGSFTGYAFAVPVSIVQKVVADLMEYGAVQRALLGIRISDLTPEVAKENNLNKINGVFIESVLEGSSADDAGLKKGDIILSIDGKNTNTVAQLQEQINRFRPGDKTEVSFARDGKIQTSTITFKNADNGLTMRKQKVMEVLGASFEELSASDLKKLNLRYGVQVTDLRSGKLLSAGVRKGFIISEINNTPVTSIGDIEKIIAGIKGGVYLGGMYPSGQAAYYAFGLE
ncbi:MAG: Do family serine endopeptidase [Bacteroidales bacterium]|nr:Do family serine endopeptidase [Bacteroidales bacterium]